MLPVGTYRHPVHGWELAVDSGRARSIAAETKRLIGNGYSPFVPDKHKAEFDANGNFGFVVDVKADDKGVWGLHELIGADAALAAARNESSVRIEADYTDGKGNKYGEAIIHNALCPDPVAGGAGWFANMSAGANAAPVPVPVYDFAKGATMPDFAKLRAKLGLAADVSEDAVLGAAEAAITARDSEIGGLKTAATAADAKIKQLSASAPPAPDAGLLLDYRESSIERIDNAVTAGDMPAEIAAEVKKLCGDESAPSAFMLSRSAAMGNAKPIDAILGLFKGRQLGKVKPGGKAPNQAVSLSRTVPADGDGEPTDAELIAQGKTQGEARRAEALAQRGIK